MGWEFQAPLLHHDFHRTESGSTIALVWNRLDQKLADKINGGFHEEGVDAGMYGASVIEISPSGEIMNTWNAWEHLDLAEDVICPLENRREWTHANSISLTPDGDFLISFRQTSTIGIVDRKTGEFTWKWGPGIVSHQHHPTMLENRNILLFDNGAHHRGMNFSKVIEIDPKTNEIVWEYQGDPPLSFYSYNISSAARLGCPSRLGSENPARARWLGRCRFLSHSNGPRPWPAAREALWFGGGRTMGGNRTSLRPLALAQGPR